MSPEEGSSTRENYPFIIIIDPRTPTLINAFSIYTKDDIKRVKHNIEQRLIDSKHQCQLVMCHRGITSIIESVDDIPLPAVAVKRTKG